MSFARILLYLSLSLPFCLSVCLSLYAEQLNSVDGSSKFWSSDIPRYVSIKIPTIDSNASGESKRSKLISSTNTSHPGLSFIRLPIDEFQLEGPEGTHFCLVYKPMRETLYHWQRRLPHERLPLPLFKSYAFLILQALDYLHIECHLIHTGKVSDCPMGTVTNSIPKRHQGR